MKKAIISFILSAVLFAAGAAAMLFNSFTDLSSVDSVEIVLTTDRVERVAVSQEDFLTLVDILDSKKLSKDAPSCVFSMNTAIQFDKHNALYCLALDSCPILYLPYQDRYLYLTHEDYDALSEILEKYGLTLSK